MEPEQLVWFFTLIQFYSKTKFTLNYIVSGTEFSLNCANYNSYGSNVRISITMGVFVDYFKPTPGNNLCQLLKSYTTYLWSPTLYGKYGVPEYVFGI